MNSFIKLSIVLILLTSTLCKDENKEDNSTIEYNHHEIHNKTELDSILEINQSVALFIGEPKSEEFDEFEEVSSLSTGLFWTKSKEFFDQFGIEHNSSEIIHFKYSKKLNKHKEGRKINIHKSTISYKVFEGKLKLFTKPRVFVLDSELFGKILEVGYPTLIIIVDNDSEIQKYQIILNNLNKKHRGSLNFAVINYNQGSNKLYIKNHLKSKTEPLLPKVLILDGINNDYTSDFKRYITQDNFVIDENNLEKLVIDFVEDNLKFNKKDHGENEEIIQDANGVFQLTTGNFDKFIKLNKSKDVVLLFCSDKIAQCQTTKERIAQARRKLSAHEQSLIYAEIDPYTSEIDLIYIKKIPYIIIIPKFDKKIRYLPYKGSFTTKDISNFIAEKGSFKLAQTALENEKEIYLEELKVMINQHIVGGKDDQDNSANGNETLSEDPVKIMNDVFSEDENEGDENEDSEDALEKELDEQKMKKYFNITNTESSNSTEIEDDEDKNFQDDLKTHENDTIHDEF